MIYRWCRRAGLQPNDAEELHQEVFCNVAQHVARFRHDRPGDSFRAWLRTITRNKLHDFFRRARHRAEPRGGSSAQEQLQQVAGADPAASVPDGDPHDDRELRLRAMELVRGEFEPRTWEAFWQVAVRGRAPADVAQDLDLTLAAVYQAKYRVLKRIRRELDEPGP